MEWFQGVDSGAYYELAQFQLARHRGLVRPLQALDFLGSYPVLGGVVLLALVVLFVRGRRGSALVYLGAVLLSAAVAEVLKIVVGRERPHLWPAWPAYDSFPSATAFVSAVVYVGLAILLSDGLGRVGKIFLFGAAVLLVMVIGTSQLFLGYSFLSDVLGGWLGAAVVLMLAPLARPSPIQAPQPQGAAHE